MADQAALQREEVWLQSQISGPPMLVSLQQTWTSEDSPRERIATTTTPLSSSPTTSQRGQKAQRDQRSGLITAAAVNDWDSINVNTVTSWRNNVAKTSFIYGVILQSHETNMERTLLITLAVGTLMTLLAAVSVALGALSNPWIVLGFDVVILIGSATITFANGLIKIFSWDVHVKLLTQIIEKLDALWYVFETELNVPADQRQNAKDFIKRMDSEYAHLMQQCPHINMDQYIAASQEYQTRLSKNLIWQYQFNRQMRTELREIRVQNN